MVPLFITSDSVLTYSPLPEPAPFPQPWVGSRAHPLDCALPSSTLVPASEGCPLCCERCYGLGVGMGVRGGGLVVRRPLAGQPRLAAGSAESLGPLGKALVTGWEGGRWRRTGRGLQPLVFSDPSCSEREGGKYLGTRLGGGGGGGAPGGSGPYSFLEHRVVVGATRCLPVSHASTPCLQRILRHTCIHL